MESNSDREINIDPQMISELMDEINKLKIEINQLKEIKNQEEEKDSFKIVLEHFKQEIHESILKNINDERAKRMEENNLQKSQMQALKQEIEKLKNGLLLLTEVNKEKEEEKEDEGLICKGDTEDIWDAAKRGFLPAVKLYFRENPENIYKENKYEGNYTPLHYATENGHLVIAQFLISKKVNKEAICSFSGSTALMRASLNGHRSIMELLLDNGAKINAQDKDNWTSLHFAVVYNHLDCVKLLIQRGADHTLRNNKNETPLAIAKRQNKKSIVKYFSSI